MQTLETKVGLFGGTFDPPHYGHREVALSVLKSGLVDHIWFLPCWKHAFEKKPTDFTHRAIMCTLMTYPYANMRVCVDEANVKSTYSVEILNYIVRKYPDKDFRLIVGADNFARIDEWKDREEVEKIARPIWVARPGFENPPKNTVECSNSISSTEVRKILKTGGSISNLVPDPIIMYMYDNKLYGLHS